ncbi:putative phage associated protein [Candidatus Regiella insecticola LSR1]|uniref:Putative phage associated protein n=1 Tax=Candidatus Regiella insecticola LSR1 TaxID=663321 RepID=E0WV48_9ENTR|nr:putative phage associated protein [Candidatus Regiella insecticola LSR1]
MTFAQQLEKRGEERGKQQGMQQGEKKASLKIAKQLLDSHVDRTLVKVATGLSDEELDTLLH